MRSRITLAVSIAIYAVLLAVGYQLADQDLMKLGVEALVLLVGFLSPAQWLSTFFDMGLRWKPIVSTAFAATLLWDVLTAYVLHDRPFLSEWLSVYVGGPIVLILLLAIHVAQHRALAAVRQPRRHVRGQRALAAAALAIDDGDDCHGTAPALARRGAPRDTGQAANPRGDCPKAKRGIRHEPSRCSAQL
mgnify:CR=1 FL=1